MTAVSSILPKGRIVQAKHGRFLAYENDFYIGKALIEYGEFSELELQIYQQLIQPGWHVVEVGANSGTLTVPLARQVGPTGRVSAFEPQPHVFKLLACNTSLNDLWNTYTYPYALGNQSGSIQIDELNPDEHFNLGAYSLERSLGGKKINVPLTTLDEWSMDKPPIQFIKLDVEGMELSVLKGAEQVLAKHRPLMHIENEMQEKSKDLLDFLFSQNYRCYWNVTPYYNPNNHFNKVNNLYPGTVTCNMICVPKEIPQTMAQPEILSASAPHPYAPVAPA